MILKRGQNLKYLPYAFTEQGVAMLSSVLRSSRAVEVNIVIMRTFVQLRRLMDTNRDLARKIEGLERKYDEYDVRGRRWMDCIGRMVRRPSNWEIASQKFAVVFEAIKQLISPPARIMAGAAFQNSACMKESSAAFGMCAKKADSLPNCGSAFQLSLNGSTTDLFGF